MSSIDTQHSIVDEVIPDQKQRFSIADYSGPAIVFALFIGSWYLLSGVILPPHKRFLLPSNMAVLGGCSKRSRAGVNPAH